LQEREFDQFANNYRNLHASNIGASGETPEFFAEYKVADVAALVARQQIARPTRILDFGAGIGGSIPYFKKYFPDAKLTCMDVSQASLEIGRTTFGAEVEFAHLDGQRSGHSDASFDLVFAACVFHHVPSSQHVDVLGELRRLVTNSGSLMIFEHNPWNPLTVRAVDSCPLDENAELIAASQWAPRLRSAGFSSPAIRYRIFFPRQLRLLRPSERLLEWLPLGAQYSVHARPV
jgi:SAM-dependent methyltransferase